MQTKLLVPLFKEVLNNVYLLSPNCFRIKFMERDLNPGTLSSNIESYESLSFTKGTFSKDEFFF
jgi:hypothetical protein